MLPRVYRSGTAKTESAPENRERGGLPLPEPKDEDTTAPQFRLVPSRWLVIRRLHPGTAFPEDSGIPELQAWVVESDRRYEIQNLGPEVDLQTDVSPFVEVTHGTEVNIGEQAEIFIGRKTLAEDWVEDPNAPRVSLSLLNGGNILFADYQPHNTNVFSIIDNFSYKVSGKTHYLDRAKASYYVIGWHPDNKDDPFNSPQPTRAERLDACLMTFKDMATGDVPTWLKSKESTRVLCHGAMYNVEWDLEKKPKAPADEHCHHLNTNIPVAVGTSPLDSLLAYVHAHKDGGGDKDVEDLIASLIHIQTLLIEQDDGVDPQKQAEDLLYNYNYDEISGGTHFYLAGSDDLGQPAKPPTKQVMDDLAELNREQYKFDSLQRTAKRVQWELFAWWWKYVCDSKNDMQDSKADYRRTAEEYTVRLRALRDEASALEENIKTLRGKKLPTKQGEPCAKPGVLPSFFEQRDPTLLVGGIGSGWPYDYLDKLKVRLDTEITTWKPSEAQVSLAGDGFDWTIPGNKIVGKLPKELQKTAKLLVAEFFDLMPGNNKPAEDEKKNFPQFHDQGWNPGKDAKSPWRDRWGGAQPWFPLFLEWEVEYTNVPITNWSLEERATRDGETKKLRYGIRPDIDLTKPENLMDDRRTLSGRVLILPQPNFSLKAKIEQLFDSTPAPILEEVLPFEKRVKLRNELYKLTFLSSPLAGLRDHLLTMAQGTHIKPNVRRTGEKLVPIKAAMDEQAGFGKEQFEFVGTETDLTPYGTLVQFYKTKFSAFKPATHGQFNFTKLNIIDKFGQAIHAIDPRWSVDPPPPIYPCISEFYAPQLLSKEPRPPPAPPAPSGDIANTVRLQLPGLNEYIQLPPHINQQARLNGTFVKRHKDGKSWVPQTEWENPIWGWIVINYPQYAIQVFQPDGTFFREARVGGPSNAATGEKWLPFDQPDKPQSTQQLDHLLECLKSPEYLKSFVNMINDALMHSAPAPSAYSQFLSSIVGKPLALVNMGFSLELAAEEHTNQSTRNETPQDWWLLEGKGREHTYKFQVKLGDKKRTYDGLVGYFNTLGDQKDGNDLKLDELYTFFLGREPEKATAPLIKINKTNYPTVRPYFIRPDKISSEEIERKRNEALITFGAIVDPFTPVHCYSGLLPTRALQLPSWTWQEALSRMTAFFHMGPLVVTQDVPPYDGKYKLKSDYKLRTAETIPGSEFKIPALAAADWNWLQPYMPATGDDAGRTVFCPLALGGTDSRPKFENGPYTATEGYLQLKKPIVRE